MQSTHDKAASWPMLDYAAWRDTALTFQLWTQIVGKVRLALTPWLNHGWHVPLYVNAHGFGTSPIHAGAGLIEIDFDLLAQRLVVRTSEGPDRGFALEPMSVATFYRRVMAELDAIGVRVSIDRLPNEVPEPIRFTDDEVHAAYDAKAVHAFWRALVQADRVFRLFRTAFLGKSSPVHLFWGSFDLAVTRFSGRPAPLHPGGIPGLPDAVTREAYSHEVSSAGFWPGNDAYPDAAFYSYAYPTPLGFDRAVVEPAGAVWAPAMGEWLLPYDVVRSAADPDAALLRFLETTYRAAAGLAQWDRDLECELGIARRPRAVGPERMKTLKVALAGAGAFGLKHLDAIRVIDGVEVVSLVGRELAKTREVAQRYGIAHASTELADSLALPQLDAVILCTPTPMHAAQAQACLAAGKHVQVEIPLADSLADAEAVAALQQRTGLVAMCGHTRRFNPSHQWVRRRIAAGEFALQQMDVQTYFLRRTNMNALGQPRSWTDHLLWHHAAHTVDLFAWQAGGEIVAAHALQGPVHPVLGIAMDMSIQLKSSTGALCTLSLSFNNDGPLGSFFRYIGDRGTYLARYDDLFDGKETPIDVSRVDVSMNGIELQDREFFAAIREGRAPEASVASVLPCYRVLAALEAQLA